MKCSKLVRMTLMCAIAMMSRIAVAQPAPGSASPVVTRMMAFDKNADGKLNRDEVTDDRLVPLFERADANKDNVVSREELTTVAATIDAESSQAGQRRGGPGGRGEGRAGPGGRGPGGQPQPGLIMPQNMRDMLNLTADQNKMIDDLQRQVDEKLATILTESQKAQLQDMRARGRRGGPPPGGQP